MKGLRIAGIAFGVLVVALVLVVLGAAAKGHRALHRVYARPTPALTAPRDSAAVTRGAYIAMTRCTGCHSPAGQLPLAGGVGFHLGPLGSVYPPNLTPGGAELGKDSDGQLARAIREGVTGDGHAMLIMPSAAFRSMSDADLHALIAYLRAQPAVTTPDSTHRYTFLTAAMVGLGMFPTSVQTPVTAPIPEVTPSAGLGYGQYLATQCGCTSCHGATLHGGHEGPPNVAQMASEHSFEDFAAAVRRGRGLDGRELTDKMPWKSFSALTDQDMRALYEYVKSVK